MFPVASKILKDTGALRVLISFSNLAGREQVGKKGIVRDSKVHVEVIEKSSATHSITDYTHMGWGRLLKERMGNIEYLLYLRKTESSKEICHKKL